VLTGQKLTLPHWLRNGVMFNTTGRERHHEAGYVKCAHLNLRWEPSTRVHAYGRKGRRIAHPIIGGNALLAYHTYDRQEDMTPATE
jgi:hypothetical protein